MYSVLDPADDGEPTTRGGVGEGAGVNSEGPSLVLLPAWLRKTFFGRSDPEERLVKAKASFELKNKKVKKTFIREERRNIGGRGEGFNVQREQNSRAIESHF